MKRVERADRFHWKGCFCTLGDVARHVEHGPGGRGPCEGFQDRRAPDLVEKVLRDGAAEHTSGLDEGQPGAGHLCRVAKEAMNLLAAGLAQEPPEHRATLRVERHRSARSASRSG